jgi:hypothetical protein
MKLSVYVKFLRPASPHTPAGTAPSKRFPAKSSSSTAAIPPIAAGMASLTPAAISR